jgi:hypothetical protein
VPIANKETTIFVTLALSCDVYHGSTITITGLTGSETADSASHALTLDKADLIATTGVWTQDTGTMVLTVSTADATTYPGGHWETADNNAAEGTVVVSFNLVQAANGQAATAPTVSGSRAFAPWQYAGGANKVVLPPPQTYYPSTLDLPCSSALFLFLFPTFTPIP